MQKMQQMWVPSLGREETKLLLFSHPVVSNSLRPHGLQRIRPPCLSPSPEVCQSLCPLHQWCHPAISSSDALLSFCPWSFQSGTFPVSQLFASDDQYWSFTFSINPSNEYSRLISLNIDWFEKFREELTPILLKLFQKIAEEGKLPN